MQHLQKTQQVSEELVLASVSHAEMKVITNIAGKPPIMVWLCLSQPSLLSPVFLLQPCLFFTTLFSCRRRFVLCCFLPSTRCPLCLLASLPTSSSRCKLKLAAETICKCESAFSLQAVVVFSPSVGISSNQYAPAPSWVRGGVMGAWSMQ